MATRFDFEGKSAIVTGGNAGIGAAIVQLLLDGGATVSVVDRDVSGIPSETTGYAADVSCWTAMSAVIDDVVARTRRIDALFNNAAINAHTSLIDSSPEEFDAIIAVNTRGVFNGMKLALPHMVAAGAGAIVNTASTAAVMGIADRATYSASKGAVVAMTRQVAVQYAASGVRCNCISPGTTDSPMVERIIAESDDPVSTRRRMETRQPIGRLAQPIEIAGAAVFLASDRASYVTGVALNVDGGWTAA